MSPCPSRRPIQFLSLLLLSHASSAADTRIEECLTAPERPGLLATKSYQPSEAERPFLEKASLLPSAGELFPASLEAPSNAFVSWFGIVRDIFDDDSFPSGRVLMIQILYSNGYTDTHLQTVSINGPGDGFVLAEGDTALLIPLLLVRVSGSVTRRTETGTPVITAEFIRFWPWGMFNFRDDGEDHSAPIWRQGTMVGQVRTYSSAISMEYYLERVGGTEEQIEAQFAWHQANRGRIKQWMDEHAPGQETPSARETTP